MRKRERERETEREKEREREMSRILILFLKGMTGALAPFSYLVFFLFPFKKVIIRDY